MEEKLAFPIFMLMTFPLETCWKCNGEVVVRTGVSRTWESELLMESWTLPDMTSIQTSSP